VEAFYRRAEKQDVFQHGYRPAIFKVLLGGRPTVADMYLSSVLFALFSFLQLVAAQNSTSGSATYTNPILDSVAADPWVTRDGDYYYLMFTNGANITLYRSQSLT